MGDEVGIFYAWRTDVAGSVLSDASSYLDFVEQTNGGFGWLRSDLFLILWSATEALKLNQEYQATLFVPSIRLIGSNGGGEAYGIDEGGRIVSIPFVGMRPELVKEVAPSFDSLLRSVRVVSAVNQGEPAEIVEIKPILFGGNPTAASNKTALNRESHVDYVRYWNKLWQDTQRR
jgi:hypothetical protein